MKTCKNGSIFYSSKEIAKILGVKSVAFSRFGLFARPYPEGKKPCEWCEGKKTIIAGYEMTKGDKVESKYQTVNCPQCNGTGFEKEKEN